MTNGFRLPQRTATLVFEGTDWDGMEVQCRLSVPLERYYEIVGGHETAGSIDEAMALNRQWADEFLTGWNLEGDDGKPVPCTSDEFVRLEPALVNVMVWKWIEAVGRVAGPLGQPSRNGATSGATI